MENAFRDRKLKNLFGSEDDWFDEEKKLYVDIKTELFEQMVEANEWKQISIPNELALKWEDDYQTRFPHFSDTAFFTLMIARGLKTLD